MPPQLLDFEEWLDNHMMIPNHTAKTSIMMISYFSIRLNFIPKKQQYEHFKARHFGALF
jgi:hypothetical protein